MIADIMQTKEAARLLLRGVDGEEVVARLLSEQKSLAAVNTAMSRIRNAVYATNREYDEYDASDLRAHADEAGVAAFLGASLKAKVRQQKQHALAKTWSPAAEAALAGLELLPRSMRTFRLDDATNRRLKDDRKERLRVKNSAVLRVRAGELIEGARRILEAASPASTIPDLALSLLAVSGRRTSELLGGASTFAPTSDPNACLFRGQLKKPHEAAPYPIPLLVPYATFEAALRVLRAKQKGAVLEPEACNAKYSSLLRRRLTRFLPEGATVHTTRAFYVTAVFHFYECECSFSMLCCTVLGHEEQGESLNYSHVRLEGVDHLRGHRGPLAV